GALRDPGDPTYRALARAIEAREPITVELLYSDQVGGQRTISRFGLTPVTTPTGEDTWLGSSSRHWFLDRQGPRPEGEVQAAAEAILRLQTEREQAGGTEQAEQAQAGRIGSNGAEGEAAQQDQARD